LIKLLLLLVQSLEAALKWSFCKQLLPTSNMVVDCWYLVACLLMVHPKTYDAFTIQIQHIL